MNRYIYVIAYQTDDRQIGFWHTFVRARNPREAYIAAAKKTDRHFYPTGTRKGSRFTVNAHVDGYPLNDYVASVGKVA